MRKQFSSIVISFLFIFSLGKSFAQCGNLLAPSVTNVSKCQDNKNSILTASAKGSGELQWFDNNNTATATKLGSPSTSYTSTVTTDGNFKYYVAEYDNVNQCYGPVSLLSLTINPKPTPVIASSVLSDYCYNDPTGIIYLNGNDSKLLAGTDVFKVTEGSVTTKQSVINIGSPKTDKSYIVEYVRTTDKQCKDSITKTITVHYVAPPAVVSSAPTIIGYGNPGPSATATLTASSLQWYQKDGTKIPAPFGNAKTYIYPGPEPTTDVCITYNVSQIDASQCHSALNPVDLCYSTCMTQKPSVKNDDICIYEAVPGFPITSTTPANGHKYEFEIYDMSPYDYQGIAKKIATVQAGDMFTPSIASADKVASTKKYWVAEHDLVDNCMGKGLEFTLTITATTAPIVYNPPSFCQATLSSVTITAPTVTGAEVYWYDSTAVAQAEPLGSFKAKGNPYVVNGTNLFTSGKYVVQVSQVINGCQSAKIPVSFTIFPKPKPPVLDSASSCEFKPFNALVAHPDNFYTVTWSYNNTTLAVGNTFTPTITSTPATYTFTATQTSNYNCKSDPATVLYIYYPPPVPPVITGIQTICENNKTVPAYYIEKGFGNIIWQDMQGNVLAKGTVYTPNLPNDGSSTNTFRAVQEAYGCTSQPTFTKLVIIRSPDKPTLVSDTIPMCYNQGMHKTIEINTQGDSIQWYLNNIAVLGGTKYDYYPQGIGIDTFSVTPAIKYKNPITKDTQICVGQSLIFSQKVQLEPYTNSYFTTLSLVKVFPNPTTSNITVTLGENESETTIVLYDILGIVLQTKKTKNEFVDFDLSGYASGIYSVSVSNKKGYWLGTVVKE